MANEQNLRPSEYKFSQEEAKKGGINSGISRRNKKTMAQLAELMLNSQLDEKSKKKVQKMCGDVMDEDATVASMIMAGQIQSATKGNTKAFVALTELSDRANAGGRGDTYKLPAEVIVIIYDLFSQPY